MKQIQINQSKNNLDYSLIKFQIQLIMIAKYQFYYMSTKTTATSILKSKIKVDNVLQLSLVQTTIEANFKAILEALFQHDHDLNEMKETQKTDQQAIAKLAQSQQNLQKEVKSLRDELKRSIEKNSLLQSQMEKKDSQNLNPEASDTKKDDIKKQISQLRQKCTKTQNFTIKSNQSLKTEIQKLKKQINDKGSSSDLESKLKQLENMLRNMEKKQKQMSQQMNQLANNMGDSQEKGDKGGNNQEIQNLIKDLNDKLEQFLKGTYKTNLDNTNSNLKAHDNKINELEQLIKQNKANLEEEKRLRNKMSQQIWKLHDSLSKVSENNLNQQISTDALKQIRKDIVDINKKLNQLSNKKYNTNDTTTYESPTKYRHTQAESPTKLDSVNNDDLRQEMLQRLKQLRNDLLKQMKKLALNSEDDNESEKKKLQSLQQSILRLDHLVADKANTESVKKLIDALKEKINYIYNMFLNQSEQDARIARKNWFCLSCDKNLDSYQGRIGSHLVNNQLKSKTIDQQIMGGGMTLRPSKSKYELPTVLNKGLRKL